MSKISAIYKLLVVGVCATCAQPLFAINVDDINANLALRRQAMQLFASGKSDDAANLVVHQLRVDFPDSRGKAAIAEELISETFLLENSHAHGAATAAAATVANAINAIPSDGKGQRDLGRALCDYGLLCELFFKDSTSAIKYYEAGLKLSPNHPIASQRLAALKRATGTN